MGSVKCNCGCQQKVLWASNRASVYRDLVIRPNGDFSLLTVTFDVNTHHHKLAARKIMAALYCWRVRTHTCNSLDIVILTPKSLPIYFSCSLGGMCGALVTSPFDVVKTRLQSDLFRQKHASVGAVVGDSVVLLRRPGDFLWHFVETAHIIRLRPVSFPSCVILIYTLRVCIRDIAREESPRALFKGLVPTLVGVIPARSINFFTYGNGKQIIAKKFNNGQENSYVHLCSAAIAGIVTSTATNPIWVVKTRLQLSASDRLPVASTASTSSPWSYFGGSVSTIRQIVREEGVRGFYKGLSASYLGVTESTIQWVLYERLKRLTASTQGAGGLREWAGMLASAGTAKCVASLITYPHEVRHPDTSFFFLWIIKLTYYFIAGPSNAATTTPRERD